MSCLAVDVVELTHDAKVVSKLNKQRYVITFILTNSHINMALLAGLLGVNGCVLNDVVAGVMPLKGKAATRLIKLFSLFFED